MGQERTASMLEKLVREDRLPPSMLFAGPEGGGKELAAIRLAAMIQCGSETACGECSACRKVSCLQHADLSLVFPVPSGDIEKSKSLLLQSRREDFLSSGEFGTRRRSIGIDSIREVAERISRQPFEGKKSVVVVLEAELATKEAQNSFLKMLEEPPRSAVIVLVTDRADRILPTIRSRCMEIRFEALGGDAIAGYLERFMSVESGESRRIAGLAEGNLRAALRLLDERYIGLRRDAGALVRMVLEGKAGALVTEAKGIAYNYTREEVGELLGEMISVLRGLIRGGGSEQEASTTAGRDIPRDISRITSAANNLDRNVDVELTLVQLLLDLTGRWY
jgi:DNA polymerase-3 subunit delta'